MKHPDHDLFGNIPGGDERSESPKWRVGAKSAGPLAGPGGQTEARRCRS